MITPQIPKQFVCTLYDSISLTASYSIVMAHLGFPAEFPPSKLVPLVEEVANLLKGRNETVSVAETVGFQFCLLAPARRQHYHERDLAFCFDR